MEKLSELKVQLIKVGQRHILYDVDLIEHPDENLFSPQKKAIRRVATGRADAVFYHHQGLNLVCKHYHRGGMVARWMGDRYFGVKLNKTRAFAEFKLLQQLHHLGLPVPVPVAASVIQQGLFYQADLVTKEITQVTPVAEILMQRAKDETFWRSIGTCIKSFHDHNVYHADLNARNILIGENEEIHLIDFDKGAIRHLGDAWKTSNLARFQRSLQKYVSNEEKFNFTPNDWNALLAGYYNH